MMEKNSNKDMLNQNKGQKIKFLMFFLMILFISPILSLGFNHIEKKDNSFDSTLKTSNGANYSGIYDGNISTMGLNIFEYTGGWTDESFTSVELNYTLPGYYTQYEYLLNRMDIRLFNMFKSTNQSSVATNTTQGLLLDPDWFIVVQEFRTPDISEEISISEMNLYLDQDSIPYLTGPYWGNVVAILDENLTNTMGYGIKSVTPKAVGWVNFDEISSNILSPNTSYYITHWVGALYRDLMPLNYSTWCAENKTMTGGEDMGRTFYGVGNDLVQIDQTEPIDMLCNFTYHVLYKPEIIDLKYAIDDVEFVPNYQMSITPGTWGYEASSVYTLDSIPQKNLNLSVFTNTTVASLQAEVRFYYIHRINASGTWQVINNSIHWNILYPYYYDIGATQENLWFLYEHDWELDHFNNTVGNELEMVTGSINVYSEEFKGLFNLWGDPLGFGDCVATFQSPNYCSNILLQTKSGDEFKEKGYLQLGKTIKFEAEIRNSFNEPISGGSGNITFRGPSGTVLLEEGNLTSNNGILNSSEMSLGTNLAVGTYEVSIFWTNGREVAFYTMLVEVRHPEGYIPPETILMIVILVAAVIAIFPISIVARKYIRQRNWDKTLRDLFVLTKEGVGMYNYSFGIELRRPELISGMISALTTFLKEATGSTQQLRTIDQEDKKVLLNHGTYTTIALLCDKDLPIIRKRLKKFSESFERHYGKRLKNWNGEITMFKETESILTKHFPVSTEDKIIRSVREKLAEFGERIKTIDNPEQVVSMMREITEFSSRYQEIINKYSFIEFSELIRIAEEKIRTA